MVTKVPLYPVDVSSHGVKVVYGTQFSAAFENAVQGLFFCTRQVERKEKVTVGH